LRQDYGLTPFLTPFLFLFELKVAELQGALRAAGVDLAAKDRKQTWLK
jgi:hypothetical protein